MTIKFKQNLGKKEIIENLSSVIGFSSKNIQKITDVILLIISFLSKFCLNFIVIKMTQIIFYLIH